MRVLKGAVLKLLLPGHGIIDANDCAGSACHILCNAQGTQHGAVLQRQSCRMKAALISVGVSIGD